MPSVLIQRYSFETVHDLSAIKELFTEGMDSLIR